MKVLMICTVPFEKNGIAICIKNYAEQLSLNEVDVTIVSSHFSDEELKLHIIKSGIKIYEMPMRKKNPLKYIYLLQKLIRNNNYDIVHAHGNSNTLAFEMLASKLADCSVRISHSHNSTCDFMLLHKILTPLFRLTVTHRFACSQVAGNWLFGTKKYELINNGIYLEQFQFNKQQRENIRNKLQINNCFILGHVGMFNEQKNHEFLISMFYEFHRTQSNPCKLLLIGAGELEKQIKQKVKDLKLDSDVLFLGLQNDISSFFSAMDVFVLPSKFEGLPYVLIEAQAAALPCVVSSNVSNEALITEFIGNVSLKEKYTVWIEKINQFSQLVRNSCMAIEKLSSAGYNIEKNSYEMMTLYSKYLEQSK